MKLENIINEETSGNPYVWLLAGNFVDGHETDVLQRIYREQEDGIARVADVALHLRAQHGEKEMLRFLNRVAGLG